MPHLIDIRQNLIRLDDLIRRLPFALDDGQAVGKLFRDWRRRKTKRRAYLLDLWTYCYVRRYFLTRFVRSGSNFAVSDLEFCIEQAFRKIDEARGGIRDPDRYPHWVVVVCRNTFLNHSSRSPQHISVDLVSEPSEESVAVLELHDDAVRATALDAAIGKLPERQRQIATMKLLEGLDYPVIHERTGYPIPSIRAYLHKALVRLRQDRSLLRILGYEAPSSGSEDMS